MEKPTKQKRFTLSLPDNLHQALTRMASEKGISAKDVVTKSLKLGMIAFETESDPSKELVIKEYSEDGTLKETRLILV